MYRYRTAIQSRASLWLTRIIFSLLILICLDATILAQEIQRKQPTWWFGASSGVNFNLYGGVTQHVNAALTTPTPFGNGFGAGFWLAPLAEYRPDPTWGIMLQAGYDDRRGSWSDVTSPSGENMTLMATPRYLSIEPSVRFSPFSDPWYVFGGPRVAFLWAANLGTSSIKDEKSFVYTQEGVKGSKGEFSHMKSWVWSLQIGVGYDFALVSQNDKNQIELSPFISFQPAYGDEPRTSGTPDTWDVATIRVGAAIKFGSGAVIPRVQPAAIPPVVERDVAFSVRAPKAVPAKRRVRETFPLRNYVFFEEGSTEVPNRYAALTKDQASSFKEEQLQEVQPINTTGRSLRQMTVYYNILNIVGDRMKRNPGTTIFLSGASGRGPEHGKARAESIKKYLVDVFGIDGSRITTEGRDKPRIPSEQPGGTKELALLRAGDRRVDIESNSPEMMLEVGGGSRMLRPVQISAVVEDPLDSYVIFNVVPAREVLASWSLELTDEQGKVQRFGPSTRDQETISGNAILGDRSQGDFKVVMLAQTKGGKFVRKEGSVHLIRRVEPPKEAVRYSILFDFDRSKTVDSYDKFLTDVVTPLIPDNGMVIIHGHTDIIGEEVYNDSLSNRRAQDAQSIIERAVANSGKHGITFQTFGMGESLQYAPFDNYFPEERFYNRTVIIDIVPD